MNGCFPAPRALAGEGPERRLRVDFSGSIVAPRTAGMAAVEAVEL